MNVTIRFDLNEAGRKASILAGGDGKQDQVVEVPQDSPHFAAALEQAEVANDGTATIRFYGSQFDRVPTVEELLGVRAAKVAAHKAEHQRRVAAHKAEQQRRAEVNIAEFRAVLAEKRTEKSAFTVGEKSFPFETPAWPHHYSEMPGAEECRAIMDSAEAKAWTEQLANDRAAAEGAAHAEREEQEAAERQRIADEAKRREEWREKYGLVEGDIALRVEDGALASIPRGYWESHSRGKNWMALISSDPTKPGGLDRTFTQKAKGDLYYMLPFWMAGDAVEFGADYYSGGGRKSPKRWYGFFVRSFDGENYDGEATSYVVLRACSTAKEAIKAGEAHRKSLATV